MSPCRRDLFVLSKKHYPCAHGMPTQDQLPAWNIIQLIVYFHTISSRLGRDKNIGCRHWVPVFLVWKCRTIGWIMKLYPSARIASQIRSEELLGKSKHTNPTPKSLTAFPSVDVVRCIPWVPGQSRNPIIPGTVVPQHTFHTHTRSLSPTHPNLLHFDLPVPPAQLTSIPSPPTEPLVALSLSSLAFLFRPKMLR
jgi:hypothetical protein